MIKTIKKAAWSKWKVARTIWPFPDGWGTYKENYLTGERIILDTGLTKEKAIESANKLNKANNGPSINN